MNKYDFKITSPLQKTSIKDIESIIKLFEQELANRDDNYNVYRLEILGNYPVNLLDEVAVVYKEVGWADAICYNDYNNITVVLKLTGVHIVEK